MPTRWKSRTASYGFYGVGKDGVLAFTDFGIEGLIELIKMHKESPTLRKRWNRSE